MDRSDVINLPADTAWLHDADAQAVCAALSSEGGAVYFVGGCVRDALLGIAGSDVDLATDQTPEKVMRLANAAGLRAVPTGLDHGTVTIVSGGTGFEVTTFRSDTSTDGRHAVVCFSTDIREDARRRDFTMNALYAAPAGQLVDPLHGMQDCLNRRVRFIEDPQKRIREDYLRILRFFRFHAWYANPDAGFDPDALDAIAQNTAGLAQLSAERIGAEMMKLLRAPDPAPSVAVMRQTGCLGIVLPGSDDQFLGPVVHLEAAMCHVPDPVLRLSALGGDTAEDSLRLSRAEARKLKQLQAFGFGPMSLAEIAYRENADVARGAAILRAAFASQPLPISALDEISKGADAKFPVKAADLMPTYQGKALGDRVRLLEQQWIASGFSLTRDALLALE